MFHQYKCLANTMCITSSMPLLPSHHYWACGLQWSPPPREARAGRWHHDAIRKYLTKREEGRELSHNKGGYRLCMKQTHWPMTGIDKFKCTQIHREKWSCGVSGRVWATFSVQGSAWPTTIFWPTGEPVYHSKLFFIIKQSNNFQSVGPDNELCGLPPLSFFLCILQAKERTIMILHVGC